MSEKKTEVINITERFKELKSLVYDYKHDKEKEIINLRKDEFSYLDSSASFLDHLQSVVDESLA